MIYREDAEALGRENPQGEAMLACRHCGENRLEAGVLPAYGVVRVSCPTCGSTVAGIALASRSTFEERRRRWVGVPDGLGDELDDDDEVDR